VIKAVSKIGPGTAGIGIVWQITSLEMKRPTQGETVIGDLGFGWAKGSVGVTRPSCCLGFRLRDTLHKGKMSVSGGLESVGCCEEISREEFKGAFEVGGFVLGLLSVTGFKLGQVTRQGGAV
jgi:hypothetical protein